MISIIDYLPDQFVGLRFSGHVSKEDYENVLIPALQQHEEKFGKINCLIIYDTSIKNFTPGAMVEDMKAGIKFLKKWNKIAFVSSKQFLDKVVEALSILIPGECKGFSMEELEQAKAWLAKED